jgi:murein L,D-transpeptidase YafK
MTKRRKVALIVLAGALAAAVAVMLYAWVPGRSLAGALAARGLTRERMRSEHGKVWLRVYKGDGRLDLMYGELVVKSYSVSTGPGIGKREEAPGRVGTKEMAWRSLWYHPGDKQTAGDLRTPEGEYRLVSDFRPSAVNYRFALLDYPDAAHRRRSSNPGNEVGIHGLWRGYNLAGRLHTLVRHTRGCIALTNREVDELDSVVGPGTRVVILP